MITLRYDYSLNTEAGVKIQSRLNTEPYIFANIVLLSSKLHRKNKNK